MPSKTPLYDNVDITLIEEGNALVLSWTPYYWLLPGAIGLLLLPFIRNLSLVSLLIGSATALVVELIGYPLSVQLLALGGGIVAPLPLLILIQRRIMLRVNPPVKFQQEYIGRVLVLASCLEDGGSFMMDKRRWPATTLGKTLHRGQKIRIVGVKQSGSQFVVEEVAL